MSRRGNAGRSPGLAVRPRVASRPRRGFSPGLDPLEGRALMATWINQGPAPAFNGQDEGVVGTGTPANPTNPVSGAVEAVAAQPNNANVVYAATVNGGVWKTTNATAAAPTWTPLTDAQITLSSGDIAFAPTDPTFQTLYVGTGSFSSSGRDGTPGRGLLRTVDGGTTWTNINPAGIFNGRVIKSVVPTSLSGGDVLLVGTFDGGGGVYRSTNGGTSFVRLSGNGTSGLPNAGVSIVEPDRINPNVFYAGVPNFGVYRSDDGGATWAARNVGIANPTLSNSRVELAASPAQAGVVYAALLNGGVPNSFYRSANSGSTWSLLDLPGTNEAGGFQGTNPEAEEEAEEAIERGEEPGGQGSIHFAMLADRTNPFVIYVAGDRQGTPFPNSVGARDFSGRAFRGDASLPPNTQWTPITNNFANPNNVVGGTSPHADARDMEFDANGNILQGNDGGLFRLVNPGGTSATRGWTSVVGNMRNTEFISVDYSSLSDTSLGGTQDVGTPLQLSPNPSVAWTSFTRGDGGVVAVDDVSTPNRSLRYSSFQNFGSFTRSTWTSTNQLVGSAAVRLIVAGTGGQTLSQFDTGIRFYQPFELNAIDPTRMVIPTQRLYESTDRGDNLTDRTGSLGTNITGIVYGGRYRGVASPGLLYFGAGATIRYRPADNQPITTLTAYPGSAPIDMTVDPQDSRRLFVLDNQDRVWATLNAGTTWTNLTANLSALAPGGARDLRTISFVGNSLNYDTAVLAVGGYGGVFAIRSPGLAGTTTTWSSLGEGMSNALVIDLRYNIADDVLLAGTLGRGAWTLTSPAASAPSPEGLVTTGEPGASPAAAGLPDDSWEPWRPLGPEIAPVPPSPYRARPSSDTTTPDPGDRVAATSDRADPGPTELVPVTIALEPTSVLDTPPLARRKRDALWANLDLLWSDPDDVEGS